MLAPKLVVRLFSILVPAARREQWRAEWVAELEHAWRVAPGRGRGAVSLRVGLLIRAAGSLPDALWLRWRHGALRRSGHALRDATRALRRRPGYSLTVIGTLALGTGSATGIFTVVDALLVRPVPFHRPDELVTLSRSPTSPLSLDAEALREWRAQERVFVSVRAHIPRTFIVTGAGEARREVGRLVEPGFLEMLGVWPVLGRGLTPEDALPGNDRVVLLGHDLWAAAFDRDPDVVGRTVELDGEPHTVIGVLPRTLRFLMPAVVSLVLPMTEGASTPGVMVMGRLRPELSVEAAQARLDEVSRALSEERPREAGWDVTLMPFRRMAGAEVRNGLLALGGGVLCLLLIACANAAGLLLLRGVERRQELELRLALGASRVSLLSQVLLESVILALAAGLVGMLLAWWSVRGLVALLRDGVLTFTYNVVSIDERVLLFAFALTLLTGIAFGTIPAWRASRTTVARTGRTSTAPRQEVRLRAGIQVAQLALAVLLLSGAGLFARSFQQIMSVPLGYDVDRLVRLDLVSLERLRGRAATAELARALDARLRALPGVAAVSRAQGVGFAVDYTIQTEEGEPRESGTDLLPSLRVDTAYFRTMGIPLLEGRAFESEDLSPTANTVIIDRDLADSLWPESSAVGRSFRIRDRPWLRVVGVTDDVKLEGPRDPLGSYLLFYPASQEDLRNRTVLLRATGDPERLAPAVRAVVRELDPGQPIRSLETGRQALTETVADPRLFLLVMVALAAAALTLAVIGVYGLVSFTVEQGRREIGIRVALGARAREIVVAILRRGLVLGSLGIMIGLVATIVLGRFVAAILYDTSPLDPMALVLASFVLLASCAGALLRPAARAAATDPAEVLRAE